MSERERAARQALDSEPDMNERRRLWRRWRRVWREEAQKARRQRMRDDEHEVIAQSVACLVEALEEMRPYARTEMEPMASLESMMVIR